MLLALYIESLVYSTLPNVFLFTPLSVDDVLETDSVAPLSELSGETIMNGPYRLFVMAKAPSANAIAVFSDTDVVKRVYLLLACWRSDMLYRSPERDQLAESVWFSGLAKLMLEMFTWKLLRLSPLGL